MSKGGPEQGLVHRMELGQKQLLGTLFPENRRYPEFELILQRIQQKAQRKRDLFQTDRLDQAIESLGDIDRFISDMSNKAVDTLASHPSYGWEAAKNARYAEDTDPSLQKALHLTMWLAFVGHFGVKRRELDHEGKPMDYFLHPIFAGVFELAACGRN